MRENYYDDADRLFSSDDEHSLVSLFFFAVLFAVLVFVQINSKERFTITDWIMQF